MSAEDKHAFLACCEIGQGYIQETEKSTTEVMHKAYPHYYLGELYLYASHTATDTASNVFTGNKSDTWIGKPCRENPDTLTRDNSQEHDYTTVSTHSLDADFDPKLVVTVDGFYKQDFNLERVVWDSSCESDTTTTHNRRDYSMTSERLNGVEQNNPWSTLEWSILSGNGSLTTGSDTNTHQEASPSPWATPLTEFETETGYGSFGSGSDPSPDPGETETSSRAFELAYSTRIDEIFMADLLATVDAGAWLPTSSNKIEPATVTLGTFSSGYDSTASGDILRTRFLQAEDSQSTFGEYVLEIRDTTTPEGGGAEVVDLVEEITIERTGEESEWFEVAPPAPPEEGFDVSLEVVLVKFRTYTSGFWVQVNKPLLQA